MEVSRMLRRLGITLFAVVALGVAHKPVSDPVLGSLTFRSIGPNPGRIDTVAGVPNDPRTYYIGGLGGLQKTTDGGTSWTSIFNSKPVSSIGAIALAPTNPRIIYIGTGEPNLRNDVLYGDGIWRSNDAGKTWVHLGLDATAHISQIAIDPKDPNIVYVAATGSFYKPNNERGIFVTKDGGKSWKQTLFVDNRTGASSVVIDPSNPRHLFAGMWTGYRTPWTLVSGGPSDGLYESHDAGLTWTLRRGDGLPNGLMGRIGLAFAPSDPRRLYALIESQRGTLWRSHDGGATWKRANTSHALAQRPFYFSQLSVDPMHPLHLYFLSVALLESTDGGTTTKRLHPPVGDNHQMWIDPANSQRLIIASDQGAALSLDGGKDWFYPQLALSQPYHIAVDHRLPYTVCVEIQDAGSACGPNSNADGLDVLPSQWYSTHGGESGWIVFAPDNDNLIYGGGYTGNLTRYNRETNIAREIAPWPQDYIGWAAQDEKYRFGWTAPVAVTPVDPHALYFGGNRLFKSEDEGRTWAIISPDLTRNERDKQGAPGGPITHDATSVETYNTLFTINPSPLKKGLIWVGTDDGLVWLTRNDGVSWTNLTSSITGLPSGARIERIAPSPSAASTAYLVADLHKLGDRRPYLYETTDFGAHWTAIVGDLPTDNYARVILPDPSSKVLFLGTAHGLYLSYNDGAHWQALKANLPVSAIYDLAIAPRANDLLVATHGRGVWILDDIRGLVDQRAGQHLFAPPTAYRMVGGRSRFGSSQGAGTSAPYGVPLTFTIATLPAKGTATTLTIRNATGLVRKLTVPHPHIGLNRVWWNLRYAPLKPVPESDVWNSTGFSGPLVLPGSYSVVLADGKFSQAQPLDVQVDPHVAVSTPALTLQLATLLRIQKDLRILNTEILSLRSRAHTKGLSTPKKRQLDEALNVLLQTRNLQGEDVLRHPIRIYEQLSSLAGTIASENAAPRPVDMDVLTLLETQMNVAIAHDASLLK